MAAMTTVIKEFSDSANSRTYTYTGHTAQDPRLVIQSRKVPATSTSVSEMTTKVISGTEDASGNPLTSKVAFEVKVRYPNNGVSGDVTAALAIFRDIVAGDEFGNGVLSQDYLQ